MARTGALYSTSRPRRGTASTTQLIQKTSPCTTLHYHTIDDAISLLHRFGPGARMAKADLKSLYPHDWPLLGMQWRNQYFVDKCLPFGLRSSPYLFNLVADALQWCHYGVADSFHYLDDFFFAGPPHSDDCSWAITSLCLQLGVPLKQEKLVLPSTSMTFLGILLDSTSQIASIPQDKLDALSSDTPQVLQGWDNGHKKVTPVPHWKTVLRDKSDSCRENCLTSSVRHGALHPTPPLRQCT